MLGSSTDTGTVAEILMIFRSVSHRFYPMEHTVLDKGLFCCPLCKGDDYGAENWCMARAEY